MSDAARGPQVAPEEDLYRLIVREEWWVADVHRPSSAAFDWPKFSVNIASLCGEDEAYRQLCTVLHAPQGAIVLFNCGQAQQLEFDPRKEPDPNYPDNTAHANVYYDGSNSSRKKRARKLAGACRVVREPSFR